jgi:hypothetical protein
MASTTFVNLIVSGTYTCVHIRQFVTEKEFNGNVKVNPDGLFLSAEEFASLMFQLQAIEHSLYEKSKSITTRAEQKDELTAAAAVPVVHSTCIPLQPHGTGWHGRSLSGAPTKYSNFGRQQGPENQGGFLSRDAVRPATVSQINQASEKQNEVADTTSRLATSAVSQRAHCTIENHRTPSPPTLEEANYLKLLLLIAGDVETNPGPTNPEVCNWCTKKMSDPKKGLKCARCDNVCHKWEKCSKINRSSEDKQWICSEHGVLPEEQLKKNCHSCVELIKARTDYLQCSTCSNGLHKQKECSGLSPVGIKRIVRST